MSSTSVTLLLNPGWNLHPGVVSGSAMNACGVGRGYHPVKHDVDSIEPKLAVLATFPTIVAFSCPTVPMAYWESARRLKRARKADVGLGTAVDLRQSIRGGPR